MTFIVATNVVASRLNGAPIACANMWHFSHKRSARIKKLIQQKLLRMPKNLGVDTLSAILGPPGGHFGFCRRCSITGGAALQAVSKCPLRRQAGIPLTSFFFKPSLRYFFKKVTKSFQQRRGTSKDPYKDFLWGLKLLFMQDFESLVEGLLF